MAKRTGFTLIELLIVVAIIAILAAIAVPNFLEAQTRAKVSRVKSDIRTMATGIETYRIDHNEYPEGTDNPNRYPEHIQTFLGPLAPGYYTFMSRSNGRVAGQHFATLTTPIAYLTQVPLDPFAQQAGGILTYAYRNAKDTKNGWIITSFGPDADVMNPNGVGTDNPNPLSTFSDPGAVKRMGDINERAVIHFIEKTDATVIGRIQAEYGGNLRLALEDLAYDPTNGTISDGDILRIGP